MHSTIFPSLISSIPSNTAVNSSVIEKDSKVSWVNSSSMSTLKQSVRSLGYFNALFMLNITSSFTLNLISPYSTSISVWAVVSKGLPTMSGIFLSSSQSKTIKLEEKINLSNLTKISSMMPLKKLNFDQLAVLSQKLVQLHPIVVF